MQLDCRSGRNSGANTAARRATYFTSLHVLRVARAQQPIASCLGRSDSDISCCSNRLRHTAKGASSPASCSSNLPGTKSGLGASFRGSCHGWRHTSAPWFPGHRTQGFGEFHTVSAAATPFHSDTATAKLSQLVTPVFHTPACRGLRHSHRQRLRPDKPRRSRIVTVDDSSSSSGSQGLCETVTLQDVNTAVVNYQQRPTLQVVASTASVLTATNIQQQQAANHDVYHRHQHLQQEEQQQQQTSVVVSQQSSRPPSRPRPRRSSTQSSSAASVMDQPRKTPSKTHKPGTPAAAAAAARKQRTTAAATAVKAAAATTGYSSAPVSVQQQGSVCVRGIVRTITHQGDNGFKIAKVQVIEGRTDPSVGAAVLKAAEATLAAAQSGSSRTGRSSKSRGKARSFLAVKGQLPGVNAGAELQLHGEWEQHPLHGWQIRVLDFDELPPSDPAAYLVGCLPGVGPSTADKIISGLQGQCVTDVMDSEQAVDRLAAIKGIGIKKAQKLKKDWDANRGLHESFAWLQQHGLPPHVAKNISATYRAAAPALAAKNPYTFINKIPGYKLAHAEMLAEAVGFSAAAPERAAAVLHQVLRRAAVNESETALTWSELQSKGLVLLGGFDRPWPAGLGLREGAEQMVQQQQLVVEAADVLLPDQQQQQGQMDKGYLYQFKQVGSGWSDQAIVMLTELHAAETSVVNFLVDAAEACHKKLQAVLTSSSNNSSSSSDGLLHVPSAVVDIITAKERELSRELGVDLSFNAGQRQAMALAASLPVVVLTGGPGCGKTLTSQAIARAWLDQNLQLAMAAPTGRAAQRLQEIVSGPGGVNGKTSAVASTIHRLLGYRGHKARAAEAAAAEGGGYESSSAGGVGCVDSELNMSRLCGFGKSRQLQEQRLLVDEVSMMDVPLAAALFNAINLSRTSLLLVGDPDQLPPVGPGRPLACALAAGLLPCVDLRQIYRTAAGSAIVNAAHAINQGVVPSITTWDINPHTISADLAAHLSSTPLDDQGRLALSNNALMLRLPRTAGVEAVRSTLLQAVQQLVPRLGCTPQYDVQVLSATKKTPAGTLTLNEDLQQLLNPPANTKQQMPVSTHAHHHHHQQQQLGGSSSLSSDEAVWRVGDRVVHLENDPERDVYNGDLGYIESVNQQDRSLVVRYPPRGSASKPHKVTYRGAEINMQLQLAWATTVHKAQGGEFPIVLMPLHSSTARILLRRPLLYTAVSRAKRLLVLVGTDEALQQCVRAGPTATGGASLTAHLQHQQHTHSSSGWLSSVQGSRLYEKLRSEAASRGLKPFAKMVYGPDGWVQQ